MIGATWHSGEATGWPDQIKWDVLSRYEQIMRYCGRARVNDWLALDDDDRGWPDDQRHHLLYCDPQTGLAGLDYDVIRAALRECGQARRQEAVKYARATNSLEGLRQSPENADQARRYIAGEITAEQAIEETKARYRKPETAMEREECLRFEDYNQAAEVLKRAHKNQEVVHPAAGVRKDLGLDD